MISHCFKKVEDTFYEPGLYFIGLGHNFVTFPRNVITLDFSSERNADWTALKSRTSDGLEVTLDVSF
jgi:hypothetical protein